MENGVRLKILVVDDALSARKFLKSAFPESIKKYSSFFDASDGEEALRLFEEMGADLVFMDLTMPKMNGKDALLKIKELSPNTHVVMVTADRQKETKKELLSLGATDVLNKPVDKDELKTLCARLALGVGE